MTFPIDLSPYKALTFDPDRPGPSDHERAQLKDNIDLVRDLVIFVSGLAGAKGLGGHTGGPYNIVPEVLIVDGFMRGSGSIYPVCFDESGHRALIQYVLGVLHGDIPVEDLLYYRDSERGLYGHPERHEERGIHFSSGRLGHMWPFANGVARADPDSTVVVFGSDGSQQEGNDAEAARHAVAGNLNIKVLIDDNNCTIAGHPRDYMPGFDVVQTLRGHGLTVDEGDAENISGLFDRIQEGLRTAGPRALVNRRVMAPGVQGIENSPAGHEAIPVEAAIAHLEMRGRSAAVDHLKNAVSLKKAMVFKGSSSETQSNRKEFGYTICDILRGMPDRDRVGKVMVIDNDLEGSTGLKPIGQEFPEVYTKGGIMERGNFSAAAGFGSREGRQGVFSTYAAFVEMLVSEITMAGLNKANVLAHFSHAGIDQMVDNTSHYGINIFLADSGLEELSADTRLYYPADARQLRAVINRVFDDSGLRFVFSPRVALPLILTDTNDVYYDEAGGYRFEPGRDEIIRNGSAGYVVSYGEALFRALDAVDSIRSRGIDVGLINKPTLNVVDEQMLQVAGSSDFVLVVESQNIRTGLGSRYSRWLLKRGFAPKYENLGTIRGGGGGLNNHMDAQGLSSAHIVKAIETLI